MKAGCMRCLKSQAMTKAAAPAQLDVPTTTAMVCLIIPCWKMALPAQFVLESGVSDGCMAIRKLYEAAIVLCAVCNAQCNVRPCTAE